LSKLAIAQSFKLYLLIWWYQKLLEKVLQLFLLIRLLILKILQR